jgi:hypothetical protein
VSFAADIAIGPFGGPKAFSTGFPWRHAGAVGSSMAAATCMNSRVILRLIFGLNQRVWAIPEKYPNVYRRV